MVIAVEDTRIRTDQTYIYLINDHTNRRAGRAARELVHRAHTRVVQA